MLGHASAAMTPGVYWGLFDDDLPALADRMDAAARQRKTRVWPPVWARPPIERSKTKSCRSSRWAPWGSNPQPAD